MKTLTKLVLSIVMVTAVVSAKAQTFDGYNRDFVYRNPYAATPSVRVHDYFRRDLTYVAPRVRTSPNWTTTDNLTYRGYGTVRVPRNAGR